MDYQIINTVSTLFNNSSFHNVLKQENLDKQNRLYKKAKNVLDINEKIERKKVLQSLYDFLLKNYRNEFIYKSIIIKKHLLGVHSINTTTALNEFRVGKSIADIVLMNGTSIAYEIKTELDNPDRLISQLHDYQKAFLQVYIVTHDSLKEKYLSFINKNQLQNVGLYCLTKSQSLSRVKVATENNEFLDIDTMFRCLRKNEYLKVFKKHFGYTPEIPNTKIFKFCLEKCKEIPVDKFHFLFKEELKRRTIKEKGIISSNRFDDYLKYNLLCLNLNNSEISELESYLSKKV